MRNDQARLAPGETPADHYNHRSPGLVWFVENVVLGSAGRQPLPGFPAEIDLSAAPRIDYGPGSRMRVDVHQEGRAVDVMIETMAGWNRHGSTTWARTWDDPWAPGLYDARETPGTTGRTRWRYRNPLRFGLWLIQYCTVNSRAHGVQYVIFGPYQWCCESGRVAPRNDGGKHADHVHLELNGDAAWGPGRYDVVGPNRGRRT